MIPPKQKTSRRGRRLRFVLITAEHFAQFEARVLELLRARGSLSTDAAALQLLANQEPEFLGRARNVERGYDLCVWRGSARINGDCLELVQ
jgi:hypothetical protein